MNRQLTILGPVAFTYSCGHRGVAACIETTPEYISFIAQGTCDSCRTVDAARALYGIDLKRGKPFPQVDVEGIIESELDDLPALNLESNSEVTHLFCADCDGLFLIEDLALQTDGRRICEVCCTAAEELSKKKRRLEQAGQVRLF